MSGTAQGMPMAARDDGVPVLTPEQVRQAAPGSLFRTTDGRLMRKPGGAAIPVMTPDQVRQAAPGTLFRTTDGRIMRARGAGGEAPPAAAPSAPRFSEGATVRQDGRLYRMQGGQMVEVPPPRPMAAAPEPLPAPRPYIDPAPTGGLDGPRRFSASGVRDSDLPRPNQPSEFTQIMGRKGADPWTTASNVAADAVVRGLSNVFAMSAPPGASDDTMPPPSVAPTPEPPREQLPVWRGLPSIPSWSQRAQNRYPARQPTPVEGDR